MIDQSELELEEVLTPTQFFAEGNLVLTFLSGERLTASFPGSLGHALIFGIISCQFAFWVVMK